VNESSRAVRHYALMFVVYSVLFGVLMGIDSRSVLTGVLEGVIFGLLMSAVLGWRERAAQRKHGGKVGPRQEVTLRMDCDPARLRTCALEALRALPARVKSSADAQKLLAVTGVTWRSWGERVSVELRPEDGLTTAVVRSDPRLIITVVDYGKSSSNVETVAAALRSAVSNSH
jgi:hypothetical protein